MKHFLTCIILAICSINLCAQDQDPEEKDLKKLSDDKRYDKIIEKYGTKTKNLTAKSLFYVGQAYYMKEDDEKCLKLMNLSIKKEDKDPAPYFVKGSVLKYMKKYEEAISSFQSAIALNDDYAPSYSGLGDCYYYLEKLDPALENYKKATEKEDCPGYAYFMLAQVYGDQEKNDLALEAYYVAKPKLDRASGSYTTTLFNIGLFELLKGEYVKAESSFLELIGMKPDDYRTCAKLIQIYVHNKEYDMAKTYRDKLYQAYDKGTLGDYMEDMYCFDQFKWNGKTVKAFERYQTIAIKGAIFRKHIYYVENEKGDIEDQVQTEYSAISVELGGPKYLLCRVKGNMHSTYNIGYNDDFNYEDLRKDVIQVLDDKVKPSASSVTKE